MKMDIKNNSGISYYSITVFLMIFYCYNYTMADIIYRNKVVIATSFALAMLACLIPALKGKKIVLDKYTILWIGCILFALINNQRIESGDFAPKMICWFAMIICMLMLKNTVNWISVFVNLTYLFTIIHITFAWIFKFFPRLFYMFSSLYDGVNRITMEKHYNSGYLLGLTTHYSTLAIYLGNGFVILLALFFMEKNNKKKKNILLLLIGIGITLAMIGKRGMLVFVILTSIIFSLIVKVRDLKKILPRLFKYVVSILAIVVFLFFLANTVMPQLMVTFNRFIYTTEIGDFTGDRARMWKLALELFTKKPIFGIGWFGYREYYTTAWYHGSVFQILDTHNVYLQLLCETGILGFCLFVGTMYSTLFMTIKDLRRCIWDTNEKIGFCSKGLAVSAIIQILFLLYCMTGNPLYDPQNFIVYFLGIAIAYSLHSKVKEFV